MPMPKIHRHKTGRYYMNPTIGGKRHSIYGLTEEEVQDKYVRLMYEYGMGIKVGQRIIMADYLRTWLAMKKDSLSPYTYQGYKGNIENHIIPSLGNKTVQDLLPADIQTLYVSKRKERKDVEAARAALAAAEKKFKKAESKEERAVAEAAIKAVDKKLCKKEPLGETSLLYIHRILVAALNDAVKNRLILTNPAMAIKPPKRNKVKKTLPEEEAIKRLFASVRGQEYELGVHLAIACGLRRGEICAVEWSDMDFVKNILSVQSAVVQTAETGKITKDPKNNEPREVFVPASLAALMKAERRRQEADAAVMGKTYVLCDYMVRHRDGNPFSPYSMSMCINRAIKNLGIETTLHGLRSVYVSLGYKHGADEKAITDSAGHHSVAFNRDRYQSVYDSMKQDLADKIEGAVYTANNEDGE